MNEEVEPNEIIDQGEVDGIEWRTAKASLYGAVNGYVRIPDDHPWAPQGTRAEGYLWYDDERLADVVVHGGLTFGGTFKGWPGNWIGFDTLHLGDVWPGTPDYWRNDPITREWTPELVTKETQNLARQAAKAVTA